MLALGRVPARSSDPTWVSQVEPESPFRPRSALPTRLREHRDTAGSDEQSDDDQDDTGEHRAANEADDPGNDQDDGQKPKQKWHPLSSLLNRSRTPEERHSIPS